MTNNVVELGDQVQCIITGFKGIAIQRVLYLQGCDRIYVQPVGLTKDGKIQESAWFDIGILKVTKKSAITIKQQIKKYGKGGPAPSIPERQVPKN